MISTKQTATLLLLFVTALPGAFGAEDRPGPNSIPELQTAIEKVLKETRTPGVGIAIGAAWSGLLSNFAAGLFLVFLRPFKVGDVVTAGGVTGSVQAIGLFGTSINTPDNVLATVGNSKIFSDTIQNFSANEYRRVDLMAQLSDSTDHRIAMRILREGLIKIPNVLAEPEPIIDIVIVIGDFVGKVRQLCLERRLLASDEALPHITQGFGIPSRAMFENAFAGFEGEIESVEGAVAFFQHVDHPHVNSLTIRRPFEGAA